MSEYLNEYYTNISQELELSIQKVNKSSDRIDELLERLMLSYSNIEDKVDEIIEQNEKLKEKLKELK